MGANMLNLWGKSLTNDQYACAGARVRQELSNTGFLPYHKPSLWAEAGGRSVSQSGKQGLR